jgi:hypothetical protein
LVKNVGAVVRFRRSKVIVNEKMGELRQMMGVFLPCASISGEWW